MNLSPTDTAPAVASATLSVVNLAKRYGELVALDNVSLSVSPGQVVGILGPNGAGKTTLIECIVGLITPDSGVVQIAGLDALASSRAVKSIIGVQTQTASLQENITPLEALKLFGAFYPSPVPAKTLLQRFRLEDKANVRFETLSAGQRQRLGLALAMVNSPRLLFLDEPTAGLDPQSRLELHAFIRDIRAAGAAILFATHFIEEAQALCNRVLILNKGRIAAAGTPAELIASAGAQSRITLTVDIPLDLAVIRSLPNVSQVDFREGLWTLFSTDVTRTLTGLFPQLERLSAQVANLRVYEPTLQDAWLKLVGEVPKLPLDGVN